jgi:hypothetical protein
MRIRIRSVGTPESGSPIGRHLKIENADTGEVLPALSVRLVCDGRNSIVLAQVVLKVDELDVVAESVSDLDAAQANVCMEPA